jgi:hypothetical protein
MAWTVSVTHGTPQYYGRDDNGNPIAPPRWPAGSTIRVFIEPDPDPNPPDRAALLQEGIERWQGQMADRGVTIEVTVGNMPDPPPAGAVPCTFEPDGTSRPPYTLGPGNEENERDGIGGCSGTTDGLTGGEIIVREVLPAGTAGEQEYIRNLGQHEFTHVLGLADDDDGEVTNGEQNQTPNNYNPTDLAEIGGLYPRDTEEEPEGEGETVPDTDPNSYNWNFFYNGPVDGHVALITMDVEADLIQTIIPPPGWAVFNPADPARHSMDYPFYEGYFVDCLNFQPPWDEQYSGFLAFRAESSSVALSITNPTISITLFTQNAKRGSMRTWAGGPVQILEGPEPEDIPTLSGWGLLFVTLLLVTLGVMILRRKVQKSAPPA